jgi:hypothetical protein
LQPLSNLFANVSTTTILNGALKMGSVLTTSITNDLSIANDQTTGRLILADFTGRTGNVFIANKQSAIIGGGDDGGVYIATDARSTLCQIRIGTAGFTTTSIRGATVNIADTGGVVNIGNSTGTITVNTPIRFGYTTTPTLSTTSIGYSIKYTFASGSGGDYTLASFANSPIGLYLLTVGPTTIYDFIAGERADVMFTTTTGIESLTSFNTMENGGNSTEKFGICFSMPIRITSATNQLTVIVRGLLGGFNSTGGASAITRIA